MIVQTKYRIKRGEVYLAKYGLDHCELHIVDVLKREDGDSMVKHQYGWQTLTEFVAKNPVRIGRTRKILGIRCGIIREPRLPIP